MKILAIETSCDDTAVAVLDITKGKMKIMADFVSSQVKIHAPYGGVVPSLAARAHYKNLPILLEQTFKRINPQKINLLAVTIGPGLEPSLWAGVNTARMLAQAMEIPIVGVNHLEGHLAANFLAVNSKFKTQNLKLIFPAICLIASGGHTQLVLIKDIGKYRVIGQTRDDAAGEALDKVAKLLGLGYPGGPEIALKAKNGQPDVFKLPRPMIDAPNYDFSFSGLKTAVLYLVRKMTNQRSFCERSAEGGVPPAPQITKRPLICLQFTNHQSLITNLCASFQQAVIEVLVHKTIKAAREYQAKTVMLSGGVAANSELRKQMGLAVKKYLPHTAYQPPLLKYCTDNAVMIALAGYWKYKRDGADKIEKIAAKANLQL